MKRLVVVFPGIGYHCDRPLLYYGRKAAMENGYTDCIRLSYSYKSKNIRGDAAKMEKAFHSLFAQACEQLSTVDFDSFDDILFVSKSVGTIIANAYAEKYKIKCRSILYTPLIQTYSFPCDDGIAFIGTGDPWSHVEEVIRASRILEVSIHVYEDADHSLETGNVKDDLKVLQDVMSKTLRFIGDRK